MLIVPEGTLDLDAGEVIDNDNIDNDVLSNDLESSERAVINCYIGNHETFPEENDTDESDCDSM